MKMQNKKCRVLAFALSLFMMISPVFFGIDVMAASVKVTAKRDAIYEQLEAAAEINVVANTMKKCIASIQDSSSISGADALKGKIFKRNTVDITTSLWLENATQGKVQNGSIYCYQSDGSNILNRFQEVTGLQMSEILCNGGNHRLLQRAKETTDYHGNYGKTTVSAGEDVNCSSFNDSGAKYIKAPDALERFADLYVNWAVSKKSENPYIPAYDQLGKFNNVDGYFSYLRDFDLNCAVDTPVTFDNKISNTTYYGITKYTREDNKIVAQKLYYHVTNNKTWSYPLSEDNPVKSCTGLLERVSTLETQFNGIGNNKNYGYGGIIINDLQNACKTAKTADGVNGWTELKTKLQEIINDPESPEEAVTEAQANLEKLNDIITNNKYMESSGDVDDEGGKVYQCANIDGLDIDVAEYTMPTLDLDNINNGAQQTCASAGGANSLGWIACPVLDWLGNAAEDLYSDAIVPMLQVNPVLFTDGVGSNTEKGWKNFRDIANVIFIILFLFVIFSQLTGYGIDNYGIKKILPKLIVAAILINLSYFICQAMIDLSNILGNSLQSMFDGFAQQLTSGINTIGVGDDAVPVELANTGGIVTVVILAALVGGAIAIFVNPALLLGLLISALSIVVSLFFLFILLGAREAAILILTVISPIAVVCFMLPNTKNLFDKWWKFFSSLLMVYPIAGLLVGGGNYVSVLLLASGAATSFWLSLVAMIIGIVPIFFIPTVLKSALNMAGQIGSKISGIGNSVKNGTVGRFAKSETRKRMANTMNDKVLTGARDKVSNSGFGRITGIRNARARQIAASKRQRNEDLEAGAMLTGNINDRFERKHGAMDKDEMRDQIAEALVSGDESKFYALQDDAVKRFGTSKASQMFRHAIENGNGKGLMSDDRKAKFLRDSAQRYAGFQAKDYALGKYMQQGGAGNGTSLNQFEADASNINDINDEQAATLNADSLARMGNVISQDMARRVMANKELRRGMDQTQQLMWANYAEGGGAISKQYAETELSNYRNGAATTLSAATFARLGPLPEKMEVVGGSQT